MVCAATNCEHRTQITEHRTQNTEHRTQNTEHRTDHTDNICVEYDNLLQLAFQAYTVYNKTSSLTVYGHHFRTVVDVGALCLRLTPTSF